MQKTTIMCLSLLLCFGLSACGKKTANNESLNALKGGLEVKENNSLTGWLKKGKAVECEVMSPQGKIIMKAKNGAVLMEGVPYYSADSAGAQPKAENGAILSANGWTYMWDKESKKGTKMNNAELDEMSKDGTEAGGVSEEDSAKDWNKMVEDWDEAQIGFDCKEASLGDDLFSEPQGVEFTDLTDLLTNLPKIDTNNLEGMNQPEVPAMPDIKDLKIPQGANQEDIEKILEEGGVKAE